MAAHCASCSWAHAHEGDLHCLVAAISTTWNGPVVAPTDPACAHYETAVHCDPCGACCREAFDAVEVGPEDEATAEAQPDWMHTDRDGFRSVRRVPGIGEGTRCAALRGDGAGDKPFRCVIYADRPSPCRDLMPGEPNCLFARRRVGLSKPRPPVGARLRGLPGDWHL